MSFAGFTPIPVQYSPSATHILYARIHVGSKKGSAKRKDAALPEGRTLFLVNVPPDATEREITLLFKHAGTVERVIFDGDADAADEDVENESEDEDKEMVEDTQSEAEADEQPRKKRKFAKQKASAPQVVPLPTRTMRIIRRTGRSAHIIFLDASSLSRALASSTKPRPWPRDPEAPSGLDHYTVLYSALRPPLDIVKAHADTWMDLFEYEQTKKKQQSKYKKGEAIVDDDGFTLVTRGGAYGQTVGGGVGVASKKFQQTGSASKRSRKSKKEPKEKDSFYAFQVHEKKRKGAPGYSLAICSSHALYRTYGPEEEMGRGQGKSRKAQGVAQVQAILVPSCYFFTLWSTLSTVIIGFDSRLYMHLTLESSDNPSILYFN
jgi:ribosomal RNA-processing protein 7